MSFRVLFNHKYVILRTEDFEEHVIQNNIQSCYLNSVADPGGKGAMVPPRPCKNKS